MQFAALLNKAQAANASLKVLLHQHLARMEPARSFYRMHASEVTRPDFCARMNALYVCTGAKPPVDYISTPTAYTYAQGHRLQEWLVNTCADMDIAVGHWKCHGCGFVHQFRKRPMKCPNTLTINGAFAHECGNTFFTPIETRFKSKTTGISGGFDMLADLGTGLLRLIEIKTMAQDQFKVLAAPLAEHKVRTALYLKIAADSINPLAERIDTQRATVIYMTKGAGVADASLAEFGIKEKSSPFKEFTVERNDELITPMLTNGAAFTGWLTGKTGMPGRICETQTCARAGKCQMAGYCFGKQFPPGVINPNPAELN